MGNRPLDNAVKERSCCIVLGFVFSGAAKRPNLVPHVWVYTDGNFEMNIGKFPFFWRCGASHGGTPNFKTA
jgi:hypothetical protein